MLNRHNFMIAELAPKDEDRPHLCGILVTPEGTSVTDGRAAVIVSSAEQIQTTLFENAEGVTPADYFTPFILDRESAIKIAKCIPKKTENEEAKCAVIDATTESMDRAMVSINDVFRQEILRATKIGGDFPDIARVVPDPESARMTIRLNPELLISVLRTIGKFCKGHDVEAITIRTFKTGQPMRIDAQGNGQTLTAVVMPMRDPEPPEEEAATVVAEEVTK